MKKRMVLCLAAALFLVAAPASAKPLVHEHYSGTDSFDFDDCGSTIHDDITFRGLFMLKPGKHGDPTPLLSDNYDSHEVLTANGKFFTIDHNGLYQGPGGPVHDVRGRYAGRLRPRQRRLRRWELQPAQGRGLTSGVLRGLLQRHRDPAAGLRPSWERGRRHRDERRAHRSGVSPRTAGLSPVFGPTVPVM
jgi:hypothetical protein